MRNTPEQTRLILALRNGWSLQLWPMKEGKRFVLRRTDGEFGFRTVHGRTVNSLRKRKVVVFDKRSTAGRSYYKLNDKGAVNA